MMPFPDYWKSSILLVQQALDSLKNLRLSNARDELLELSKFIDSYIEQYENDLTDITSDRDTTSTNLYEVYDISINLKYIVKSLNLLIKVFDLYLDDTRKKLHVVEISFPKVFKEFIKDFSV